MRVGSVAWCCGALTSSALVFACSDGGRSPRPLAPAAAGSMPVSSGGVGAVAPAADQQRRDGGVSATMTMVANHDAAAAGKDGAASANAGAASDAGGVDAGADETPARGMLRPGDVFSSGAYGYCAISSDGTPVIWGSETSLPIGGEFLDLRFRAVSLGGAFDERFCGITDQGAVACYDHTADPMQQSDGPPADKRFVRIAQSSYGDLCGILESGEIECYGGNQLQPPAGRFIAISGKDSLIFCAVREDGEAVCWPEYDSPQRKPSPGPFRDIVTGADLVCGILQDGRASCWRPINDVAYVVPGEWLQLDVGGGGYPDIICGVRPDRSATCVEAPHYPTDPSEITETADPTKRPPPGEYFAVAMTMRSEGCGVRTDGSVVCWYWGTGMPRQVPPDLRVRTP